MKAVALQLIPRESFRACINDDRTKLELFVHTK